MRILIAFLVFCISGVCSSSPISHISHISLHNPHISNNFLYTFTSSSKHMYYSVLFNASVAIHNPYLHNTTILEFPSITHNSEFHIGAVAANPHTNLISVIANAAAAFSTQGKDVSGTNNLMLLDPANYKEIYRLNLTETTKGTYGGFQDVEFDERGNIYVVGSFPASILRIEGGGNGTSNQSQSQVVVNEWYKSTAPTAKNGMAGLAVHNDILLANDNAGATNSSLVKFDMALPKGTPVPIPISNNRSIAGTDAIHLPSRYNGTVLLAAVDASGVEVLRSKDGRWDAAEGLGLVSNKVKAAEGAFVTGTVQIGTRVFMIEEFFADVQPGTRERFPLVDITEEVERLMRP